MNQLCDSSNIWIHKNEIWPSITYRWSHYVIAGAIKNFIREQYHIWKSVFHIRLAEVLVYFMIHTVYYTGIKLEHLKYTLAFIELKEIFLQFNSTDWNGYDFGAKQVNAFFEKKKFKKKFKRIFFYKSETWKINLQEILLFLYLFWGGQKLMNPKKALENLKFQQAKKIIWKKN